MKIEVFFEVQGLHNAFSLHFGHHADS